MTAERAHTKPLTDDEIDEIVAAEADDPDAWDEPIRVTPKREQTTPPSTKDLPKER